MKRKNTLLDLQRDVKRVRYPFRRKYSAFDPNPRVRYRVGPNQYMTRAENSQETSARRSAQARIVRGARWNVQKYVRNRRVLNHVKKLGMITRAFKSKYPNRGGGIEDVMRLVGQYAGVIK